MVYYIDVTQDQMIKLANLVSKGMKITLDDAQSLIYDEYDLVEDLFDKYKRVKDVANRFRVEVNEFYKIA